MSKRIILALSVILALSLMVSCSGGGGAVTAPDNGGNKLVAEAGNGTAVAGLWQIVADKNSGSVDVVQLRSADKMLNVIGFMEPPPLTLMDLDWPGLVIDFVAGTIHVGVKLTHPLGADPDATFTGFDVRGVCFGPEVVNADGLTIAMSPEFFTGEAFGYQDGLLGVPAVQHPYTGWAGYKYYCDGIGPDDDLASFFDLQANVDLRGKFTGTTPHQRNFDLKWADPADILIFNYAIYANYDWPVGTAPFTLDEFPITTANSAEAFCVKATETANSLWSSGGVGGGAISLDVEVWDWLGDISDVTVESVTPGVIASTPFDSADGPGSTTKSWDYSFDDVAASPTTTGDLDILITVTDAKTFGQAWFLDLLSPGNSLHDTQVYAAWIHTATVIDCPVPTVVGTYSGAGIVNDKVIDCNNLIAGGSLGVKLTDGMTDWVGTDIVLLSATQIRADFDLTTAPLGAVLDIVVTNGCSTQGTGVDAWEVLYAIKLVGAANISIGAGTATDIAVDPDTDRGAFNMGTFARVRSGDFGTQVIDSGFWAGFTGSNFDVQNWGAIYGSQYVAAAGQYPIWAWGDWANWGYGASWFGGYYNGMRDECNQIGTSTVYGVYDFNGASAAYFFTSVGVNNYSFPYTGGAPFYNGSGTTGVVMAEIRGIDITPAGGPTAMYFLEGTGGTASVVEKWNIGNPPTYSSVSFGSSLNNSLDVTVDSAGIVYVLGIQAGGSPEINAYDASGVLVGKSGAISAADISGTVKRIDSAISKTPDEVDVLHSDGVSRFTMY